MAFILLRLGFKMPKRSILNAFIFGSMKSAFTISKVRLLLSRKDHEKDPTVANNVAVAFNIVIT